jgi:hypothetical protein
MNLNKKLKTFLEFIYENETVVPFNNSSNLAIDVKSIKNKQENVTNRTNAYKRRRKRNGS